MIAFARWRASAPRRTSEERAHAQEEAISTKRQLHPAETSVFRPYQTFCPAATVCCCYYLLLAESSCCYCRYVVVVSVFRNSWCIIHTRYNNNVLTCDSRCALSFSQREQHCCCLLQHAISCDTLRLLLVSLPPLLVNISIPINSPHIFGRFNNQSGGCTINLTLGNLLLLVDLLQVVKRTHTPLIPLQMASSAVFSCVWLSSLAGCIPCVAKLLHAAASLLSSQAVRTTNERLSS